MQKVAIHQPQYMPWPAYFDKILQSDAFIFLDNVQFQKNGLQNRNEIKTPQGKAWLTLPIKHSFGQAIKDVEIDTQKSKVKHLRSLKMNYAGADCFSEIFEIISPILEGDSNNLCEISIGIIKEILKYLDYKGEILYSSNFSVTSKANDLVLDLCRLVEAEEYLSGTGGLGYLVREDFDQAKIDVKFQKFQLSEYKQCFPKVDFIPDLSILDLLFNKGKDSKDMMSVGSKQYLSWDEIA